MPNQLQNYLSNAKTQVLTRMESVKTLMTNKFSKTQLTKSECSSLELLEKQITDLRDKTYKFADVLFKSVSWLILIGVLISIWNITHYGLFLILLIFMILGFLFFALMQLFYP